VKVSSGKLLEADHIMIATGSQSLMNLFPGSDHCWTSDDIFAMDEVPKSMAVIGGGYIGVEMSQILAALGCKVTTISRDVLVGLVDQEIAGILHNNMVKLGIDVRLNSPHKNVELLPNGMKRVNFNDGTSLEVE
jgi:glutathione reductase (NADPH)